MSRFLLSGFLLLTLVGDILVRALVNVQNVRISTLNEVLSTDSSLYGPMPLDDAEQAELMRVINTGRANVDPPSTDMNKAVSKIEDTEPPKYIGHVDTEDKANDCNLV